MKKGLIGALVLMLGISSLSLAQNKEAFNYGLSEIKVAPFEKISIQTKVEVVLVHTELPETVFVEGNLKDLSAISISSKDGELIIQGTKNYTGTEKLVVTVYYNNLKRIAGRQSVNDDKRLTSR